MKFDGSLFSPRKFSSLKKDMMWFVWRQKFMVSYNSQSISPAVQARGSPSSPHICPAWRRPWFPPTVARHPHEAAYLVIGVTLHEKDIDHGQLVDEAVALELLPHAGADGRDGLRDRVHGLDLGRLVNKCVSAALSMPFLRKQSPLFGVIPPGPKPDMPQSPSGGRRTNWPLLLVSRWSKVGTWLFQTHTASW
jgi:hypothetical protein